MTCPQPSQNKSTDFSSLVCPKGSPPGKSTRLLQVIATLAIPVLPGPEPAGLGMMTLHLALYFPLIKHETHQIVYSVGPSLPRVTQLHRIWHEL